MSKGQFQKIKGAICNIPIDTSDTTNILLFYTVQTVVVL